MSHNHEISLKTYTGVYLVLLVLLVVTVLAAYVELGPFAMVAALTIATIKAALIAVYFMHLKHASRWVLMFFLAAVYMLLMGGLLTFADYRLRY